MSGFKHARYLIVFASPLPCFVLLAIIGICQNIAYPFWFWPLQILFWTASVIAQCAAVNYADKMMEKRNEAWDRILEAYKEKTND